MITGLRNPFTALFNALEVLARPKATCLLMLILLLVGIFGAGAGPTAAAQPELGERTLSRGSWGADVFRLQQALIRVGYELEMDGHFGRSTQRAVTAFQLAHGLKPDGVVGPRTVSTLLSWQPTIPYIVELGDSLWSIAQQFDTTMDELVSLNNLSDGPLRVGAIINVPTLPQYTVQPGDTLSGIAKRFATTVALLAELNEIDNPNLVRTGTTLRLPGGAFPTEPGF